MTSFLHPRARHDRHPALEDAAAVESESALEGRSSLKSASRSVSFLELHRDAEDVARRLMALGMGPGRVVAVKGGLTSAYVTALHGCWLAGVAVAPMNASWTDREEAMALRVFEPSLLLLADKDEAARWEPPEHYSGEVFSYPPSPAGTGPDSLTAVPPHPGALPTVFPATAAARLLTSGTAGQPAGVTLPFANLLGSARASAERLGSSPSDVWLASLSPAHVGGLALLTRGAVLGLKLVLRRSFRVDDFLSLAAGGTVTHASLVPTMLHQVLEAAGGAGSPEALRCLLVGGAPTSERLLERALTRGYPVALTYGLTEASSQVATAPPDLVRRKPGTVGPPLPGVEIGIDQGQQILVRGPTLAAGVARSDGWLETGDLGRLDDEGDLWILGRSSDRIISGGVNVDPAEVEGALRSHPMVADVVVVGIPSSKWGEVVAAAVVFRPGDHPSEDAVSDFARQALSPAKRPKMFRIVEAVPRNANGKVDRARVRSLFL